jgi:hypothetical protein
LFLIEGIYPEELGDGEDDGAEAEPESIGDGGETPEISLNALAGVSHPQTMQVRGRCKGGRVMMLVDTGSTHNFLSSGMARKLGLQARVAASFEVAVANGERIHSEGRCVGAQVCINDAEFFLEFFLLPMEGCEAVLGAQWLRMLGQIMWDFANLYMKFTWKGKDMELWGMSVPRNRFVDSKGILQGVKNQQLGFILFSINLGMTQGGLSSNNPDLLQLLEHFAELFEESQRLPPRRNHDHCIPLKHGTDLVSVHPDRYPHYQKTEIEKIVSGLLETGMIRPNTSPYSSPVLLVKKHDGSW